MGYRVFTREPQKCWWALWTKPGELFIPVSGLYYGGPDVQNSSQKIFLNAVAFCVLTFKTTLSQANPLSYNFSPRNDTDLLLLIITTFQLMFSCIFFSPPPVKSFEDTMKIAKTQHKDCVVLLNFKGPLTQPQPAGSVKKQKTNVSLAHLIYKKYQRLDPFEIKSWSIQSSSMLLETLFVISP